MNYWNLKGIWFSKNGRVQLNNLIPNQVKSIAVIRHAALGDMILTRNFLIEAKNLFPNAKITFSIISNYTRGIPEDLVDRLHIIDVSRKNSSAFKFIKNARKLGEHDIIFDLAITSRSIWISKLNKAKLKIGFPYRTLYRYLFYDITVPRCDLNFEADDMLNLLKIFRLQMTYPLKFKMPGLPKIHPNPYILYFTSASNVEKCWPIEKFAALIKMMSEKYSSYDHLIMKGISDWESIDIITQKLKTSNNVLPLDNVNSVEDISSYVKGARLVISNDTSVRNIAIASNIPTIGIFFQTPPYRYLPQNNIHLAVFKNDCSIPEINDVYDTATNFLDQNNV
jgi:ADP-heptose:LPS heptosyltransferase